jgi:hypothetical protein
MEPHHDREVLRWVEARRKMDEVPAIQAIHVQGDRGLSERGGRREQEAAEHGKADEVAAHAEKSLRSRMSEPLKIDRDSD